ncbi:hypothetical protein HCJ33_10265 [Listeria seeligeri]|uniref:hypothetical protein n=1 Tax=Listeria seeligeri TaxID=1640 RepID=UPI0016249092|nr:hypothetical protein [Listeria seeligeri]MBC1990351.1 hypothetical protein [Listeria seeligeri]
MGLLFERLFKKIERTNNMIVCSLVREKNREAFGGEVKALKSLLIPIVHEMKDYYDYGVGINEKDIARLDDELKEGQLLLYALQMTEFNLKSYNKYFETKKESIYFYKDIMFHDTFNHPGCWLMATAKEIMENEEIEDLFCKPIGYCSEKFDSEKFDVDVNLPGADISRVKRICEKEKIIDLEPGEYLEKWNKTFQD